MKTEVVHFITTCGNDYWVKREFFYHYPEPWHMSANAFDYRILVKYLHNENGYAVITPEYNKVKSHYLDGRYYEPEEYEVEMNKRKFKEKLEWIIN